MAKFLFSEIEDAFMYVASAMYGSKVMWQVIR